MQLIPKNWVSFQHYKHRSPPWIKFHRSILNDRNYSSLPLASKALAPLMWLLASESKDGTFDGSLDELVFRLHITPKDYQDGVKPLIDKGFFIVASGVLAECKQVAIPERETEKEIETEKRQRATSVATPSGVSQSVWQEFVNHRKAKKAQVTQLVIDGIQAEADKAGFTLEDALKEIVVRNWQGFKAEWVVDKQSNSETVYQRSMRIKMQQAVPDIAAKQPNQYEDAVEFFRTIEVPVVVKQIGGAK